MSELYIFRGSNGLHLSSSLLYIIVCVHINTIVYLTMCICISIAIDSLAICFISRIHMALFLLAFEITVCTGNVSCEQTDVMRLISN